MLSRCGSGQSSSVCLKEGGKTHQRKLLFHCHSNIKIKLAFKFAFGSELIPMYFYSKWKHTHGGKVRLVDLFDSVVASIEVSGVFGERGHTIQIQVIAVD